MIRTTAQPFAALGVLLLANPVFAVEYFVSPGGTGEACTRAAPCNIHTGATLAIAGDAVTLLDGIYKQGLSPQNSGTPDAWITFQADQCAVPIIEGDGEEAILNEEGDYPSGVYTTGSYIRFVGIVSRYWDSGFTNVWTGEGTTNSNGHIEYINCIGDGNHRTAFAMYSAGNFTVRECIAAHSGGSTTHSWSSGIQMYAVQGTPEDNIVERSISFENYDAQKNNDGSGFIVDEYTTGATFLNNIGFGNGGSCMRLTRSSNTRMLHFSCYHNGQNPTPNSPTDPGEFYFTDQFSRDTATVMNTLAAASGTPANPRVFVHPPETGLVGNVTVDSGAAPFFSDPEGLYPDFRPPVDAGGLVENLGAAEAGATVDIGLDPQCVTKLDPDVPFRQPWWTHSVNYEYIRSIGGVAACFHPKQRTGGADVGAYELSGAPHEFTQPGSCEPIVVEPGLDGSGGTMSGGQGGIATGGDTSGDLGGGVSAPGVGGTVGGVGSSTSGSGSSCRLSPSALRPDGRALGGAFLTGLLLLALRRRQRIRRVAGS